MITDLLILLDKTKTCLEIRSSSFKNEIGGKNYFN